MSTTPDDDKDSETDDEQGSDGPSYSDQVKQSAKAATKALQSGLLEYAAQSKATKTKLSVGGVALPGVYSIEGSAKGYTSKYIAQKNEARSAAKNYSGPKNPYGSVRPPGAFRQGLLLNGNGDPIQNGNGDHITIADPGPSITAGETTGDDTLLVVKKNGDPFKDGDGNDLTITAGKAQLADGTGNPVTVTGPTKTPPEPKSDGSQSSGGDAPNESGQQQTGEDSKTKQGKGGGTGGSGSSGHDLPPPPKQVTVKAYCTDQTWQKLDALREKRTPIALGVGEFTIDDCGITDLSRSVTVLGVNNVTIKLKQHRQVVVQTLSGRGYNKDTSGEEKTNSGTPTSYSSAVTDLKTSKLKNTSAKVYKVTQRDQRIPVNDGEKLENLLIDMREPNAGVEIYAKGANWKIRNIGFKGHTAGTPSKASSENTSTIFNISGYATNKGIIENVYLGDGARKYQNGKGYVGGIWLTGKSSGTIDASKLNVQGIPNNGFYGSDAGGPVKVSDSYFANNDVSGIRLGSTNATATNCTVVVESDAGGMPANINGPNRRGVWQWYKDATFDNCDIAQQSGSAPAVVGGTEGGTAILKDCSVSGNLKGTVTKKGTFDTNPDTSKPSGVPTSATEAALTGTSGGSN